MQCCGRLDSSSCVLAAVWIWSFTGTAKWLQIPQLDSGLSLVFQSLGLDKSQYLNLH